MFSLNRWEIPVGMVEIILDEDKDKSTWDDYDEYNSVEKLLIAREAYIFRNVMRGTPEKKVLVTVCNFNEYLLWNFDIAHIVSSAGWIFAPYIYNSNEIENQIKHFREWLNNIYYTYDTDISVFADGLGTYLIGKYLKEDKRFSDVCFDKIIFSKTALNPKFDWEDVFEYHNINLIINMIDSTKKIKRNEKLNNIIKIIKKDELFGDAYKEGFNKEYEKLLNLKYNYKNNYIRVDEFKKDILPMFHISDALKQNSAREVERNICEIMRKDVYLHDISTRS